MTEGKSEVLTMVVAGGLFLIGVLTGGNKLLMPRVFVAFQEKEIDPLTKVWKRDPLTGQDLLFDKIRMQPLPGVPDFVVLKADGLTYPIPERDIYIYRLYRKVTTPTDIPTPDARLN